MLVFSSQKFISVLVLDCRAKILKYLYMNEINFVMDIYVFSMLYPTFSFALGLHGMTYSHIRQDVDDV